MARFNNNMFQDGFEFEDFDRTGIMDPGMADVIKMRKEANAARDGANDQYTADVADFKNNQATEAEQGIASLPDSPTGMVPDMPIYTNPYVDVFTPAPAPAPAPVVTLPDLGLYDYNNNVFDPTPAPYTDPYEQGDNYVTDDAIYNPTDDIIDVDIPTNDYPFVDPETGGDLVLVPGDPTNPGPGVVVTDPETGELPPGFVEGGGDGPAGTIVEPYIPPAPTPAPIMNPYTNRAVKNPYRPFEQPSSPVDEYIRPMDPAEFGSAPGMNQGGRVPMGNNNILNSGLSRLPLNQQNDTLTQVFQSGFRPRR
tara:strand:- start:1103 stop:2029 length:927 start_codon:yes stop_codon:yes gene_type:complete